MRSISPSASAAAGGREAEGHYLDPVSTTRERPVPIVKTLTNLASGEGTCSDCPWPEICEGDNTCWELERAALRDVDHYRRDERQNRTPEPTEWTSERAIAAIQRYARERGEQPRCDNTFFTLPYAPSFPVVRRLFGSWNEAIAAAGFEPKRGGRQQTGPAVPPRHSTTSRRPALAEDGQHTAPDRDDGSDRNESATVEPSARRPPSADLVERTEPEAAPDPGATGGASTQPKKVRRGKWGQWTLDEAITAVETFALDHGRPPRAAEAGTKNDLPSLMTVSRLCTGWSDLIEKAGLVVTGSAQRGTNLRRGGTDWDDKDKIVAALKGWATEHGQPPLTVEWTGPSTPEHPSAALVKRVFGNWGNAIAAAGFDRPHRGNRREQTATQPKWIKVKGTGLAYRTPDEAFAAADEIDRDGELVASRLREAGNEARGDQAIDQARELARKVRDAAHAAHARENGHAREPVVATNASLLTDVFKIVDAALLLESARDLVKQLEKALGVEHQ